MRTSILLAALLSSMAWASAEVFVQTGDDLAAACERAISTDKRVHLSAGAHHLPATLGLNARHSGLTIRGDESALLSGGTPLTDWREAEAGVWECKPANLPQDRRTLRILRVGEEWATLARQPNFDPRQPLAGGWLFTEKRGVGKGRFGECAAKIHTPGDWLEWQVNVPSAGHYRVFFRYAADNAPFGTNTMAGRTQLQIDEGSPVVLQGLEDTGDWGKLQWSEVTELDLPAGQHRLRWTNVQGGGLNFDAIALSPEANWRPAGELKDTGRAIVIQAEAIVASQTKEGVFPESAESGELYDLPYKKGDLHEYADVSNLEIHMFPAWGWVNAIVYPESINSESRMIHLTKTQSASEAIWPGNRYYIANSRSDMDQEGEWCIDRKSGTIAIRSKARPTDAVLPALKKLITIEDAQGITITGVTFRDTTCSSDFGVYSPDDACISVDGARDIHLERNRFLGIGGYALALGNQSTGTRFVGNEVADGGQGGVILTGNIKSQPTDTLIAANWIHDCGRLYKHVAGVYALTASRTRIANNRIERLPRYGVSLKSFDEGSYSAGNIVEYNEIYETNLETNDTGAIETLGRHFNDMNNTIRFNRIRDVVGMKTMPDGTIKSPFMTWGIYLDDYSSGTTIYGNIVENTQWGAVCIHGGANNTVENNIFIEGAVHQLRYQPRDDRFRNNRVLRNIFFYRNDSADLFHSSGKFPPGSQLQSDYNDFWHASGAEFYDKDRLTPEGTLKQWQSAGYDRNSLIADPLFNDMAHGDYSLRQDSPALTKLGFVPIPTERIGPKGWREKEQK